MPGPPPLPRKRKSKKRLGCGCASVLLIIFSIVFIGVVGSSNNSGTTYDERVVESHVPDPEPVEAPARLPLVAPAKETPPPVEPPKAAKVFDLQGKVVGVTDGDTITILTADKSQVKIRLEGIDAPEAGQEYGSSSKEALAALIAGRMVGITTTGKDRYGRTLGWIDLDGMDVNRRMVSDGWAWHFIKYNSDAAIAALQDQAIQAKRGLWQAPNPPMAPWDYRALASVPGDIRPQPGTSSLKSTLAAPQPTSPAPKPQPVAAVPKSPARSTPAVPQRAPEVHQNTTGGKYWINSNGVRHNARCRWYANTKSGHYGDADEGRACGKCGG